MLELELSGPTNISGLAAVPDPWACGDLGSVEMPIVFNSNLPVTARASLWSNISA